MLDRRENQEIREALYEVYSGKCQYCGQHFPIAKMCIEHIIPRAVPLHIVESWLKESGVATSVPLNHDSWLNFTLACLRCNAMKSANILPPGVTGLLLLRANENAEAVKAASPTIRLSDDESDDKELYDKERPVFPEDVWQKPKVSPD